MFWVTHAHGFEHNWHTQTRLVGANKLPDDQVFIIVPGDLERPFFTS